MLPQKRGFHCNRCPPPSEQERPSSPREAGNASNPCDVTSEEKEYDDDCEYPVKQNPIREGYVVSGRGVCHPEVILRPPAPFDDRGDNEARNVPNCVYISSPGFLANFWQMAF